MLPGTRPFLNICLINDFKTKTPGLAHRTLICNLESGFARVVRDAAPLKEGV